MTENSIQCYIYIFKNLIDVHFLLYKIHDNLFSHSVADGHSGCCCVLAIVKNAAVNIFVHVLWFTEAYISHMCILRNRITVIHLHAFSILSDHWLL